MDSFQSLLVGFVIGTLFFLWDNKKGYTWYKRWYDLSHKKPLERNDLSFINNQPFSKRLIPGIILTALFMWLSWMLGDLNIVAAALSTVIALVGVVAGFYVGPFVLNTLPKTWREANKTLQKIDDLEKDLKQEDKDTPKTKPTQPDDTGKDDEDKDDKDWRKGVKDYLDK